MSTAERSPGGFIAHAYDPRETALSNFRAFERLRDWPVAKSRVRAARGATRLLAGPISGAIPQGYVRSIVERSADPLIAAHLEEIAVLAAPHIDRYSFDSELPPRFRRSKAFDQRHIYRLNNVNASPRTGLCWLPGGPILEESYGGLIQLLGWGRSALEEPLRQDQRTMEGTLVVLAGGVGYFHWLLESLPAALHALAHEPDAELLLPKSAPRFVEEAIEILGITRTRRSDEPVRAEHLVLAAKDSFSGFVPAEDVEIVRSAFLPKIRRARSAAQPIYVSRRLDSRSPVNETQVEQALSEVGVEVVVAQDLPLAEQIALFSATKVVVGPHGAGLANMTWSKASTTLVEIHAPVAFNDCYARLVVTLGGRYRPVVSTRSAQGDRVPVGEVLAAVDDCT